MYRSLALLLAPGASLPLEINQKLVPVSDAIVIFVVLAGVAVVEPVELGRE